MLRFLTAGESHGPAEVAILEGIPAGLTVMKEDIQKDLEKRRGGAGRGGRGRIETDQVEILSGIRSGKTIGSPIALIVKNLDFENWKEEMQIEPLAEGVKLTHSGGVINPRPGHADMAGSQKYNFKDIRNVIERASARETVMRVAVGAICRKLLSEFDIEISSQINQIGNTQIKTSPDDKEIEEIILRATKLKNTLGGIIEIKAHNVPVGLGSYVHWDRKLDGKIAKALMSIPSVKAVEIGEGIENAGKYGSDVHDEIYYRSSGPTQIPINYYRKTNRAGGLEGGMTNGENIICRIFLKPISTLGSPLQTVDIRSKKPTPALIERSDICVVPRAGIIGEAMLAFVLADAFMEKFGGDNISETKRNYLSYLSHLGNLSGL